MIALLLGTAMAQQYSFPTSPSDYGSFYVTSHFDNGGVDYACGSDTYGGHTGNDFGAGSWAGMSAGRDINAAADGVIQYIHDGERDDCTGSCTSPANVVQIQHADGRLSIYGHLKQWSIPVSVGQSVSCGDKIGEMGSSGQSSGPHLHFAVYENGATVDSFAGSCSSSAGRWVSQGVYQGLPGLVCDTSSGGGGGGGCSVSSAALPASWLGALLMVPGMLFRRRP